MKLRRNVIGGFVIVCAAALTVFSCKQESGFSGSSNNAQAAAQKPAATPMPIATPLPTVLPVIPSQQPVLPSPNLPPNAVTKGSFTVWANPANPAPGQNYDIFIAVRLPTTVSAYMESDLSGSIIGTDGYQQAIKANSIFGGISMQTFSYVPGSGVAQLVVHVPGAQTKVQDTVNVHSALLNESQNIAIFFQ